MRRNKRFKPLRDKLYNVIVENTCFVDIYTNGVDINASKDYSHIQDIHALTIGMYGHNIHIAEIVRYYPNFLMRLFGKRPIIEYCIRHTKPVVIVPYNYSFKDITEVLPFISALLKEIYDENRP